MLSSVSFNELWHLRAARTLQPKAIMDTRRLASVAALMFVAGCGDALQEHEELKAALDGCNYGGCGYHHPGYEDGSAVRCLLMNALAGEAARLEVSVAGDGGDCGNVYDIYLGSDRTAYRLLRTDLACDQEVSLETCALRDDAALQACVDALSAPDVSPVAPCAYMNDWLVDCRDADEPTCG